MPAARVLDVEIMAERSAGLQALGLRRARGRARLRCPIRVKANGDDARARRKARSLDAALFFIDEPFSGTNTVERIAATKAVLDAIAARAQVLVTTHDVELQALLGDRFVLLHFREDPEADGFFDYRVRRGASTERNALRVLARLGMPAAVVRAAEAAAAELGAALEPGVDASPSG